jgi:hypothetical protein
MPGVHWVDFQVPADRKVELQEKFNSLFTGMAAPPIKLPGTRCAQQWRVYELNVHQVWHWRTASRTRCPGCEVCCVLRGLLVLVMGCILCVNSWSCSMQAKTEEKTCARACCCASQFFAVVAACRPSHETDQSMQAVSVNAGAHPLAGMPARPLATHWLLGASRARSGVV